MDTTSKNLQVLGPSSLEEKTSDKLALEITKALLSQTNPREISYGFGEQLNLDDPITRHYIRRDEERKRLIIHYGRNSIDYKITDYPDLIVLAQKTFEQYKNEIPQTLGKSYEEMKSQLKVNKYKNQTMFLFITHHLNSIKFNYDEVLHFEYHISNYSNLIHFALQDYALGLLLKKMTNLKKLQGKGHIDGLDAKIFEPLKSLEYLELSAESIHNLDYIANCSNLKVLKVRNKSSYKGEHFDFSLLNNLPIEEIRLDHSIYLYNLDSLLKLKNRSLKKIRMVTTNFDSLKAIYSALPTLKESMPHCEIIHRSEAQIGMFPDIEEITGSQTIENVPKDIAQKLFPNENKYNHHSRICLTYQQADVLFKQVLSGENITALDSGEGTFIDDGRFLS